MKSMKKILSAILIVAILSAFFVLPASAAISSDAQICETIDILRGDSTAGVTEEYLAKNTLRTQGAMISLRFNGREADAVSYTGTATFTDAQDATPYWHPVLAYLKANPDAGWAGYPDGSFGPNSIMTAQELYKVLLVSLGYEQGVDFEWEEVFTFAASKGLTALFGTDQITNDDMATALVETLEATRKDGQQMVMYLIDEGVVSLGDAQDAGLVPEELMVTDAFPSGSKEITATFSMPVPEGTIPVLKRNGITMTADLTWESNRQVVKFTRTWNFSSGDYTVTVGDSTKALTVMDEYLMDIVIGADHIYPLANQDLMINLVNQYGEPMTITNTQVMVININKGTQLTPQNMGTTIKVDASDENIVEGGDTLSVTVSREAVTKLKTITVYAAPTIQNLYVAGLEIAGDAATIEENTNGHKLVFSATDQYGNPYIMTQEDIDAGGSVILLSSNETSIPSSSFYIDSEGKLVFNALSSGTSTINIIVPLQAITSQYTVSVNEPSTLTSLFITTSGRVTAGGRVDLSATAYDQNSVVVPLLGNFDPGQFTVTSTNPLVIPHNGIFYDPAEGVLYVIPVTTGTTTLTYNYGSYYNTLSVNVEPAPEPTTITAVDFPAYFEVGADMDITLDDITVKDQYGQTFDMTSGPYTIDITRVSGTTVDVTGGATLDSTLEATTTEGSSSFRLTVMNGSTPVTSAVRDFTVTVIGTGDISSFSFNSVSTMYSGYGLSNSDYHKTLVITGRYSGQDVVLAGGEIPDSITSFTISNTNVKWVSFNSGTNMPNDLRIYADAAGTAVIKAWVGGQEKASVTVVASDAAPTVNTLSFDVSEYTIANGATFDVKTILTIKDQYGVEITSSANVYYGSSTQAVATINQSGIIQAYSVDGSTTISVVETSGAGSAVLTLNVE